MNRKILVTTQFEGIHCWKQAWVFPEVQYLEHPHRHMFTVKVVLEVYHNDREVEFIMVKHLLNKAIASQVDEKGVWQLGGHSCEYIAEWFLAIIENEYPGRFVEVSVLEDSENGCIINNAKEVDFDAKSI